ncbi:MAG: helix-turn-helix transcriptional regulator [Ruminococcaceae bacterium]|nr:helix-turn-helix transcriptional regulator [Oscillospiraceae bacterium]
MLKIGEKIKELRKAQDVTQEKLADYLNISFQAISKWENGLALPDITLLPKLANFFGVSADELLDLKKSENEAELRRYEKEYQELNRKGKVLEKIELSRKVLDLYPRNYQWMLNLAYGLVCYNSTTEQIKYSQEHKFKEEAIGLCERVLEDCTVDSIRHSAIQILCYNYPDVGKKEAAIKLAEDMPNMLICKEMLLSHIYSGTERLKQEQNNLRFMLHFCSSILYLMACDKELQQGLSVEQRIKILDTAISLNKTMLAGDENENLYNSQLSLYYLMMAKLYSQKMKAIWLLKICCCRKNAQ